MKKIDNNMRGQNVYMQMKMQITSMGHTRTMKIQTWAKGTKKSFVKTIYPPKDKGITFLSLDNQMWQYHQDPAFDDVAELDGLGHHE